MPDTCSIGFFIVGWTYFWAGVDWLYFSARAQFDQTSPQIVENVNQWAEIPGNSNVLFTSDQNNTGFLNDTRLGSVQLFDTKVFKIFYI